MQSITTEQLQELQKQNENFTLVNTLDEKKFASAHIPGSQNVPADDSNFEQKVEQLVGTKDAKVVVYCASKQCDASTKAATKLDAAGFSQVLEYEGGTEAWQQSGGKLAAGA